MAALLRGAFVVDLAASDLPAARQAFERAISTGAFGPGYKASPKGDAVVFEGGLRLSSVSRGRLTLSSDGRVSFELQVGAMEWARVAQSVLVAALASVLSTLALHWIPTWALPLGGAAGVLWAVLSIGNDRRRLRKQVRALCAAAQKQVG